MTNAPHNVVGDSVTGLVGKGGYLARALEGKGEPVTSPYIRVELCFCPICGDHVEWQGNDYGYLCNGSPSQRHEDATAQPVSGTFTPDAPEPGTKP